MQTISTTPPANEENRGEILQRIDREIHLIHDQERQSRRAQEGQRPAPGHLQQQGVARSREHEMPQREGPLLRGRAHLRCDRGSERAVDQQTEQEEVHGTIGRTASMTRPTTPLSGRQTSRATASARWRA